MIWALIIPVIAEEIDGSFTSKGSTTMTTLVEMHMSGEFSQWRSLAI